MPHLGAAYNLARWIMENEPDAEDAVQESYLRAFRFFGTLRGENSRAWLLTIVRNVCYDLRSRNRIGNMSSPFDEEIHGNQGNDNPNPETILMKKLDSAAIKDALARLPVEFREALVLRELEGLSYKEIADVAKIPMGTVMSRIARGRELLRTQLANRLNKEK